MILPELERSADLDEHAAQRIASDFRIVVTASK